MEDTITDTTIITTDPMEGLTITVDLTIVTIIIVILTIMDIIMDITMTVITTHIIIIMGIMETMVFQYSSDYNFTFLG